ncbi:MAG: WecB/TagA/CpsF family glycosyltransferase [Xanthobacteraceae bacterium]
MRNSVFGLSLSDITRKELVKLLVRDFVPPGNGPRLIATANLDHVANLARFPEFRDAYNSAWLITADGAPVYLYARLRGIPLGERVTGADLFPELVSRFTRRHRVFFIASSELAVRRALDKLKANRVPTEHFKFLVPPFGFEDDEAYSYELTKKIREHRTTHLLMCVGSPKSELWVWRHRAALGDLYAIGLGASLEFFAGTISRAPPLFRKLGFEWIWRLAMEPRRLARRYLWNSMRFLIAVFYDLSGHGIALKDSPDFKQFDEPHPGGLLLPK